MPTTRRSLLVGGASALTLALAGCVAGTRRGGTAPVDASHGEPVRTVVARTLRPGTDVSSALERILARLSRRGGGVVRINRPGRYYAQNCRLASDVTLRLGKGVVLALPDRSRAVCLLRVPDGGRNMRVEGPGTLDGNRDRYAGDVVNRGDIVYSENGGIKARNLSLVGVRFVDAPRSGVTVGAGLSGLLIQRCDFRRMTRHAAIAYNSARVRILDNTASRAADRIDANTVTFQYWANPGHDVHGPLIRGNRIRGRAGTGEENAFIGIELHADGSGRIRGGAVVGNRITEGSMGVSIANCSGAVVRRNAIASMDYCGVEVASGTGVRVEENTYDGRGKGSGVRVNNVARSVVIESNRIVDWADRFDRAGVHSNATSLSGASIRRNVLRGSYQRSSPMYLANVSDAVIARNDIKVASTGSGLYYIDVRAAGASCDGNVIRDNHVENTGGAFWTNGLVSIRSADGQSARGNRITGNVLLLDPAASGLAVALDAEGRDGITGTVVAGNTLSGPFTSRIRQRNTARTATAL